MDPVTERLLERTRARREQLAKKMTESNLSPRKRRAPLVDNNSQEDGEGTIIATSPVKTCRKSPSPVKISRPSPSPVKPSRQAVRRSSPSPVKSGGGHQSVRSRMKTLSQQRAMWGGTEGVELDSPKNVAAPRHHVSSPEPASPAPVPSSRRSRFAALAANINSWEDDTNHPVHVKEEEKKPARVWQPPKPKEEPSAAPQPIPATRRTTTHNTQYEPPTVTRSQLTPAARSPIKTVDRRQEQLTPSRAHIRSIPNDSPKPSPRAASNKTVDIYGEKVTLQLVARTSKVISSTVALTGVPRQIAITPTTTQPTAATRRAEPVYSQVKKVASPMKTTASPVKMAASPVRKVASPMRKVASPIKKVTSPVKRVAASPARKAPSSAFSKAAKVFSPPKAEPRIGALAMSIQQRLKEHERNWQSNDINKKIQEERKKEMETLRMRWEYPRPRPTTPQSEEEEEEEDVKEEVVEQLEEVEDTDAAPQPMPRHTKQHISLPQAVVVEEPKIVEEYQQVQEQSPIEEEQYQDDTMEDDQSQDEDDHIQDDSAAQDSEQQGDMNITDVLGDIDDLIDEAEAAMEEEEEQEKQRSASSSSSSSSSEEEVAMAMEARKRQIEEEEVEDSFIESEEPADAPSPPPRKASRSASSSSDDGNQSLMYSIDAYRSQRRRKEQAAKVVKKIVREEEISVADKRHGGTPVAQQEESLYDTPRNAPQVNAKEKTKALMEEVSAQQSIIHQTTQALNLIASNMDYKGSMEEVEAERLLLLATQRRHACLNEIQRLKNPSPRRGILRTSEGEEIMPCSGSVTIQDIRLPLKTEYVLNQTSKDRACHYYIVLFRQRDNVIATQMLSTVDGMSGDCLPFTNMIAMNSIDSDFVIEVGVFEMHCRRSKMDPMADKKSNFLNALTPKKLKSMKHSSKMPSVSSPGGPGAVRSSAFTLMGTSRLSLASGKVNRFTLSKVPFNSPLEGSIHLSLKCRTKSNMTFRGWLTMFDDISGYGAWHRRWCVLNNGFISYWTFPDQEKAKPPIGSIDLHTSNTEEVSTISRILCARPNTFEVVTCRPASKHDKPSLVTSIENRVTSTMHRLSADTKEERIAWIDALNTVLLDIRTWNRDPRLN